MKMKLQLKGRHIDSIKESQTKLQNMIKMVMQNDFQKCFQSWKSRWNHCINAKGNYFKGDGANINFVKWLSYGTGMSGTFGYHHVYTLYTVPNYTQYTNNRVYTSSVLFKYKCMYMHKNKYLPNVKKVCLMNRYWKS